MEQKRPADIFQELLDYLWNGLGLEEKGWKRLKKGNFKKRTKNGLTYLIWFERSRYNYIDYEIGHGNVEVGFSCFWDFALYHADQYAAPTQGSYSTVQSVDGSTWYKQYAQDTVEKTPYTSGSGKVAYNESIVQKLPPAPQRKERM